MSVSGKYKYNYFRFVNRIRCVLKILFWGYLQVRKNTFRPLFVFIRCKVASLISHDARIPPSSTYTFHSTKIQKSPRHNF